MPAPLQARARFSEAAPVRRDGAVGVALSFRLERTRLASDRVDDFADLGPGLTVPAVFGLGKVLRILRAARIAPPSRALDLVDHEEDTAALLDRAVGTALRLCLRPRFRLRFVAWTETGVARVDDVEAVREQGDAYLVQRRGERLPIRFARADVVRQQLERERWHEVLDIERA